MKIKRVCCAIISKEKKVLIAKRADVKYKGLWEFPGGKVNEGESDKECLERELVEELEIKTNTGSLFCEVEYDYPDFKIHLLESTLHRYKQLTWAPRASAPAGSDRGGGTRTQAARRGQPIGEGRSLAPPAGWRAPTRRRPQQAPVPQPATSTATRRRRRR